MSFGKARNKAALRTAVLTLALAGVMPAWAEQFQINAQYDPSIGDDMKPAIQRALDLWNGWLSNSANGSATCANILFTYESAPHGKDYLAFSVPTWYGAAGDHALSSLQYLVQTGDDSAVQHKFQDAVISINSDYAWYKGASAAVPDSQFDLTSTIIHEVSHAMGMLSSYDSHAPNSAVAWGQPSFNDPTPRLTLWDSYLENQDGTRPAIFPDTNNFSVTNPILFDGPSASAWNYGQPVGVYSPSSYKDGSSVNHPDNGVANAVLNQAGAIGLASRGLSYHEIGVLMDLGWQFDKPAPDEYRAPGYAEFLWQNGSAWEGGMPPDAANPNVRLLTPQVPGVVVYTLHETWAGKVTIESGARLSIRGDTFHLADEAHVDGTLIIGTKDASQVAPSFVAGAPVFVGINGSGKVEHSRGSASFGELYLGYGAASKDSSYTLAGSQLTTQTLHLGYQGKATLTNSSGSTHIALGDIVLGEMAGSEGVYTLLDDSVLQLGTSMQTGQGTSSLWIGTGQIMPLHASASIGVNQIQLGVANTTDAQPFTFGPGLNVNADDMQVGRNSRARIDGALCSVTQLEVQARGATPVLTLISGALNVQTERIAGSYATAGSVNQSGGTHLVTDTLTLGGSDNQYDRGDGYYTITGGTLQALHVVLGEAHGHGTFKQTGGTVLIKDGVNWWGGSLSIGDQTDAIGSYDITDSTLDARSSRVSLGYGVGGTLTMKGTAVVIADSVHIGQNGSIVSKPEAGNQTILRANSLVFDLRPLPSVPPAFDFGGTLQLGHDGRFNTTTDFANTTDLTVEHDLVVGYASDATVNQTGGTVTAQQALRLADAEGVKAHYTIGDGQLTATQLLIGSYNAAAYTRAEGTVTQTGGTVTVTDRNGMQTGSGYGASGRYELIDGMLSVQNHFVGYGGLGTFVQSGGTHRAGYLGVGYFPDSQGTYSLSGGTLSSGTEIVGVYSRGGFTHTGGTNDAEALSIGYAAGGIGSYSLSGGTLNVTGAVRLGYDGGIGSLSLSNGATLIADSMQVGPGGTFTLPPAAEATPSTLRLNHFLDWTGSLTVNANLQIGHPAGGSGVGNMAIVAGQDLTVTNETVIGHSAPATLTQTGGHLLAVQTMYVGYLAGGQGAYQLNAGSIDAIGDQYIGFLGSGSFHQTGGAHHSYYTYLGESAGSAGAYDLSGGSWDVSGLTVGDFGDGVVSQTGGTAAPGWIVLGKGAGSHGAYALTGGTLSAGSITVGQTGSGALQLSGTGMLIANAITLNHSASIDSPIASDNLSTLRINRLYGLGSTTTLGSLVQLGSSEGYDTGLLNVSSGQTLNFGRDFVVGYSDLATFTASGGNTTVAGELRVGELAGVSGTVNLSLGSVHAASLSVGLAGTGQVAQTGGTLTIDNDLSLGAQATASGTYTSSSGALNIGHNLIVGSTASGAFTASGGAAIVGGEVHVGEFAGASGNFNLNSGSVRTASLYAGVGGDGQVSQAGGTLTIDGDVSLGLNVGGSGAYNQTGGTLDARQGWFYVGRDGVGSLSLGGTATLVADAIQLGSQGTFSSPTVAGNHSVLRVNALYGFGDNFSTGGSLQLGHDGGSCGGTLAIADGQSLAVARDFTVGYFAQATVSQTGGTVGVGGNLTLAATDTFGAGTDYTLRGGTLDVRNGTVTIGQNAPATLTLRGNALLIADQVVRGSQGTLSSFVDYYSPYQYATLRVNSLVNFGNDLTIAGRLQLGHDGGSGEGNHTVAAGQNLTVYSDLSVGYQTTANFTQAGNVTVNGYTYVAELPGSQADYAQTAGTLSGGQLWVGYQGMGSYAQSGGANRANGLAVGGYAGSTGFYTLTGGTVDTGGLAVGFRGRGIFNQQGGTANFTTAMTLGSFATGDGTYTLSAGGTLNAGHIDVGYYGAGTFNQQGGNLHLTRSLYVGHAASGTGTYNLGAGTLTTDSSAYVGLDGTGQFVQTGGDHQLRTPLFVGYSAGASGTYELRGGSLYSWSTPQDQIIGYSGQGSFNQTGGSIFATRNIVLGHNTGASGTFNLSGDSTLTADTLTVGEWGQGSFTQTAGIAQLGVASVAAGNASVGSLGIRGGQFDVSNGAVTVGSAGGLGQIQLGGSGQIWADSISVGAGSTFTSDPAGPANTSILRINRLSGVDALQVGGRLQIGHASSPGSYTVGDQQSLTVGGDLAVGYTTAGTFTQTGGSVDVGGDVTFGVFGSSSGSYTLSGGTLRVGGALSKGSAWNSELIHDGGTLQFSGGTQSLDLYRYTMASTAGSSVEQTVGANPADHWNLSTFTVGVSGSATVHQIGGTVNANTLIVGDWGGGTGSYQFTGGSLSGNGLTVRASSAGEGTFRGHGVVNMTGQLVNNGQIIADGQGTPSTLDLSAFSMTNSWINNSLGEAHGWYATNKGQLLLPAIHLDSWHQTYNWGEGTAYMPRTADDPGIDMVNSVQLDFHGLTIDYMNPASLHVSLLSTDRDEVAGTLPADMRLIGLWDIHPDASAVFTSADVSIRYDDALATTLGLSESDLRMLHFDGTKWEDVTAGVDTVNKWVYATDRSSFSFYAVGVVPEPTLVMTCATAFAFLTLTRRHRRRCQ